MAYVGFCICDNVSCLLYDVFSICVFEIWDDEDKRNSFCENKDLQGSIPLAEVNFSCRLLRCKIT